MAEDLCGIGRVQAERRLKTKAVGEPNRRSVGILLGDVSLGPEAGR